MISGSKIGCVEEEADSVLEKMLSSSKIVMLCDDICLQFERGFSCEEIVQRCQSMLGTKDLGSICAEIQGGEQLATKFANDVSLELCGLRMYKVLRMMKTPVREVMLSIDKLRLFAVRCMHLGLESSYWKLNKTRWVFIRKDELKHLTRHVPERKSLSSMINPRLRYFDAM